MDYVKFVTESNKIEGIERVAHNDELKAMEEFVTLKEITLDDLISFTWPHDPLAVFRDKIGMTVGAHGYYPCIGGAGIIAGMDSILSNVNKPVKWSIYRSHIEYMKLLPFTGANGLSGRAIWAWQMENQEEGVTKSFRQHFYEQCMEEERDNNLR